MYIEPGFVRLLIGKCCPLVNFFVVLINDEIFGNPIVIHLEVFTQLGFLITIASNAVRPSVADYGFGTTHG